MSGTNGTRVAHIRHGTARRVIVSVLTVGALTLVGACSSNGGDQKTDSNATTSSVVTPSTRNPQGSGSIIGGGGGGGETGTTDVGATPTP